jgi:hypothetical protein
MGKDTPILEQPTTTGQAAANDAVYEELLEGDFLLAVAKHFPAIDPEDALSEPQAFEEAEEDKPTIAIAIDKAREEPRKLLSHADDPENDDPSFLYDWIMPT